MRYINIMKVFGISVAIFIGLIATPVNSQLVVDINEFSGQDVIKIAVIPFGNNSPPGIENIATIIAQDLERSGLFIPIEVSDLPARPTSSNEIDYADWRLLGVSYVVLGKLLKLGKDQFQIEFSLHDVYSTNRLTGARVQSTSDILRFRAHEISDKVYRTIIGQKGAFATRIVYVSEHRISKGKIRYRLNVALSNGNDSLTILDSPQPVMSPAWSPDGNSIAYVSLESGKHRIYIQNLQNGSRRSVASYPGINSSPAFSPDGRKLAISLSKDGNAEIYTLDIRTKRLQRITTSSAIDTEPSWSPDGQMLIFTSDRSGQPQVYQVKATGGEAQRITFYSDTYNADAEYMPDGKNIVFVHGNKGAFKIATMNLSTGAMNILTDGSQDESPSVAPNGRLVVYSNLTANGSSLATVADNGNALMNWNSKGKLIRDPAWSPFLTQ